MKIVPLFLKYDYGIKERGESLEKRVMLPALATNFDEVSPFWLEENSYNEDKNLLQKNIIDYVDEQKPDIVFTVLMNEEISIDTIKKLAKEYIVINWFCDDQWRFYDFSMKIAPFLTYVVTVDKYSIQKYKKLGCQDVILSQWASFDYIKNLDLDNINYKYDISFVGGKNLTREWFIKELKKEGYEVACFGSGWENGRISFSQMKDVFLHSKINLNLSNSKIHDFRFIKFAVIRSLKNIIKSIFQVKFSLDYFKKIKKSVFNLFYLIKGKKNVEQIKARNFEICGFGGFQLTQYALEIEDYYNIGKEIIIFTNLDELKRQISYYLENEDERKCIAESGYLRTANYTYDKRFRDIFQKVKVEINKR